MSTRDGIKGAENSILHDQEEEHKVTKWTTELKVS